jgi:hypothetical protein
MFTQGPSTIIHSRKCSTHERAYGSGGRELTRWLVAKTEWVEGGKIEWSIPERPLLHVCSNSDIFGALENGRVTRLDIRPEVEPDIVADITKTTDIYPNTYAACFADVPWVESWRMNLAAAIKEMLRIAPVAYVISPWILGAAYAQVTEVKVSQRPGVNHPILFVRYERPKSTQPPGTESK